MAIPILALPIVLQITTADAVPNWDVTPSCRGAISAGHAEPFKDRLKVCLDAERRALKKLSSDWFSFPAPDRIRCVASIKWFEPTYTELASCLEMSRDARKHRKRKSDLADNVRCYSNIADKGRCGRIVRFVPIAGILQPPGGRLSQY